VGAGESQWDRGPRRLETSLAALAEQLGVEDTTGLGRLFGSWPAIVGPTMADHVEPVRVDAEVLVVQVDHPAWATQIKGLGDQLLDRIAEKTSLVRPRRLEVRIRRSRQR
jgi:predicted nucleic acid-binding Zn ribbon protein